MLKLEKPLEIDSETIAALKEISNSFATCQIYVPRTLRFKISMPHGKIIFNRKIALDLIDCSHLLHVVDTDTGFGAAQYLHGQSMEDVWAPFIECWVAVYSGMPDTMATDQGSCFTAERWNEIGGENGIVMQLSAKQAHNALGIGKRYHAPLRRVVNKIYCSTPGMAKETALKLAVQTTNVTMGPSGLVPSYFVFGSLPRFPASATIHPDQETRVAALQAARLEMESIVAGLSVDTASRAQLPEAVDSVGLGDRRGCDECKELLESEQWLTL
jgi:hypothetical protein